MPSEANLVQLIVGLGNPGPEYANTRHNAGQDLVELLAHRLGTHLQFESKFFGLSGRVRLADQDLRLLVPSTFMNRSGQALAALSQFYKIAPENILVVHDELDLPPGISRFKVGGGHGGHNGLRDIISTLANNRNFSRLRLGIGHPGNASLVSAYVLKKAQPKEREEIERAIDRSLEVLPDIVSGNAEKAMRQLHLKPSPRS